MKTTLGRLRALVAETIMREAWVVNYTEKNGMPGKPRLFGGPDAERLAMQYASMVKDGEASPVSDEAPAVNMHDVNSPGYGRKQLPATKPLDVGGVRQPSTGRPNKGSYKVYPGSKKHHPGRSVVTRVKNQVYGPATGAQSKFVPNEIGDVSFDGPNMRIKKRDTDHTQTWEPFDQI